MIALQNVTALAKALLSNPQMIRVKPRVNLFLAEYLSKFRLQNIDGRPVIHSHLPAMNSRAFTRFINEHLLGRSSGPTHAQISVTSACAQNCVYCYNKGRSGRPLATTEIIEVITGLKKMGVVWLGLTGGEPLLNRDLVEIVRSAGDECSVKLFTTGTNLTGELAAELREAGLFYVSVSLDHPEEEIHDKIRGKQGAYKTALRALDILKRTKGLHVSVSAVISREMIRTNRVEEFLRFLIALDIHEIWLSETKPSGQAFWREDTVITEEERAALVKLQDRYNKKGKTTVNYLGHFESSEHFGCSAGHKMVYVDAFGEVSPCVFTPITFGNVRDKSIQEIFDEMKGYFPSENSCFINKNYRLLQKYYRGQAPICKEDTLQMMKEVHFDPLSKFFQLYYEGRN